MAAHRVPFQDPDPLQVFRQALQQGRFLIQQCRECGGHVFYPRTLCNHCGSMDLKWVEASGRGRVHATTVMRGRPGRTDDYNVSLIELEEGPRLMSRVVDVAPEKVKIGMPVSALVSQIEGEPAVLFITKEQGVNEW